MQALLTLSDRATALCRFTARLGAWMIVPLIAVITFDVVARKIPPLQAFVQSTWLNDFLAPTRLQEFEWHLHAVMFLLAYGLAYLEGAHVRVDLWRERRTPRARGLIELICILVLALPFCAVLLHFSWQFVVTAYVQNEGSPSPTGIPHRWVIKSFLLVGTAMLMCSLLATLMRLVVYLFGDRQSAEAAARRLALAKIVDAPGERA